MSRWKANQIFGSVYVTPMGLKRLLGQRAVKCGAWQVRQCWAVFISRMKIITSTVLQWVMAKQLSSFLICFRNPMHVYEIKAYFCMYTWYRCPLRIEFPCTWCMGAYLSELVGDMSWQSMICSCRCHCKKAGKIALRKNPSVWNHPLSMWCLLMGKLLPESTDHPRFDQLHSHINIIAPSQSCALHMQSA